MLKRTLNSLLLAHFLTWAALAAAAYATAGNFKFASCWPMILFFFPPAGFIVLILFGYALIVLLIALVDPATRTRSHYPLAIHGMMIITGLIVCLATASAAVTGPSCL